MLQLGFGTIVTKNTVTAYRQMAKCRLYLGRAMPSFYPYLKSCALHRDPEIVAFFKRISEECMNLQGLALQLLLAVL